MMAYTDLTLEDVRYYWGTSTLMFKKDGEFIPCYISGIDPEGDFPIRLSSVITRRRVIHLRLSSFIRRVVMHHPAVGYGDVQGLPMYLAPQAGQNLRKGVDTSLLVAMCPIDWSTGIKLALAKLTERSRNSIYAGRRSLPAGLWAEYKKLRSILFNLSSGNAPYGLGGQKGRITITDRKVIAQVLHQSVNGLYPRVKEAMRRLSKNNTIHGVSLSRDFAFIRTSDNELALYHRMSKVGIVKPGSRELHVTSKLTDACGKCVVNLYNKLRS